MATSKLAPLVLTTGRRRLPIVLGGATAMATGCLAHAPTRNMLSEQSETFSRFVDSSSLVVPTLEASVRAARLVGTACSIVLDYQVAKMQGQEDSEITGLETKIESLEAQLEKAQIEYSVGTEESRQHKKNLSPEEKIEFLNQQKQKMQGIAADLAAAEEELCKKEDLSTKSKLNRKSAERLLKLCRENGGVYIKVGQHLANLDYLIPREYIEVLSSLFNDAPQSSIRSVHQVIEEDLGESVDELYENFDPVPIASASLAQVHVAYCRNTGKKLAVKIQHKGLRETSAGDLFAVTLVVRVIDSLFDDFEFGWIATEMAPQLPKELDFTLEGKNAEQASEQIQKSGLACCIPKVIWENTTERVLTMEFEEGFKSTDIESLEASGLKKSDVAKLVSSVFNSQVFLSGFVHCDPHPGNCLIRKRKDGSPEMVLVDHGLYKRLDNDFRITYAELWRSLMMADLDGIEKACSTLGVEKMYPLFAAMLTARPYDEIIERSKTGSLAKTVPSKESQADKAVIRGYAKQFLGDIIALLGQLPPQMLLLLKMNDCLRHIDMALESPSNTLVIAGKYASKAVYQHRINDNRNRSLATTRKRFQHWLDYVKVMVRIQVHDIGVWILSRYSNLRLGF